jgi:hypothetical protein
MSEILKLTWLNVGENRIQVAGRSLRISDALKDTIVNLVYWTGPVLGRRVIPVNRTTLWRWFRDAHAGAINRGGIRSEKISAGTFRITAGHRWAGAGATDAQVCELLGIDELPDELKP